MNRRGNGSTSSSNEKIPQSEPSSEIVEAVDGEDLHRGLKARHITMIAIGGAIGTGLIIGT